MTAFVLLVACTNCQSAKPVVNPNPQEGNADAQESADDRGNPEPNVDAQQPTDAACQQPLDAQQPFYGCPARFDDPSWKVAASTFAPRVLEQVCTGYLSRSIGWGTHGSTCYYDPATQVLVAGQFFDDVPTFCERTSSSIVAGAIPLSGTCSVAVEVHVDSDLDGGTPEPNADAPGAPQSSVD